MLGRTDSRLRLLVLLVVFVVASLALVSRLAFWQVVFLPSVVLAAWLAAELTSGRSEKPSGSMVATAVGCFIGAASVWLLENCSPFSPNLSRGVELTLLSGYVSLAGAGLRSAWLWRDRLRRRSRG